MGAWEYPLISHWTSTAERDIKNLHFQLFMIAHKYGKMLKHCEDLAEIIGIIMGDGSLYLDYKNKYHAVICFNKKELQYLNYVSNLVEIFFQGYKFNKVELTHEFFLRNVSVYVGQKLIEFGLKSGNKIHNKLIIPDWIFENRKYLKRFVRGFFDTDGSVYRKYDNYAQIEVKLDCEETLNSIRNALLILGFSPTKIQTGKNKLSNTAYWKVNLIRQNEISRFFHEIKPKNVKHELRYRNIKYGGTGI